MGREGEEVETTTPLARALLQGAGKASVSRELTARLSGRAPGWEIPGTSANAGDMVELYPQPDPKPD